MTGATRPSLPVAVLGQQKAAAVVGRVGPAARGLQQTAGAEQDAMRAGPHDRGEPRQKIQPLGAAGTRLADGCGEGPAGHRTSRGLPRTGPADAY